ncbi:MAG: hypothetical protein COV74_01290 [Candidatus Omnitrophica bacterium CG11_big_fil_rev_8_21_14_0_20_45_26]|uniref:TraG P-loop domain-containing protein n=1 Tax=Candidatus Abzuiibacterium crystallinum TaxID=1974748 RepID=A0A2H0LU31_9BACT|nr:MAG: hypothetical protein COV74_01290 [Candidatus Omnitrophica bacterium CG11_big_fil_rev_8_21_14_0_20_45_26]PIW64804.1 MAG: hypothetical protein COW12_04700 [Candidatus Omnitrophica bacterium CG12_big_fil_rev_8_21_14_0_65_45_16]
MSKTAFVRIRELIQNESRLPFVKGIDLYAIEENLLLGVSGTMGSGLEIEGRDLLLESGESISEFENLLRKFLNQLPDGMRLHFSVQSRKADLPLNLTERNPVIERRLAYHLGEGKQSLAKTSPCRHRKILLFIVTHPFKQKTRSAFVPDLALAIGHRAKRMSKEIFLKTKTEHFRQVAEIRESLRALGFDARDLVGPELMHWLEVLIAPGRYGSAHDFSVDSRSEGKELLRESLRSRLLETPPLIEENHFYLGGYFHQAVNLRELPDETDLKMMKSFESQLGNDYLLTLTIEVPEQEKEKTNLRRHANFAKAQGFFTRMKDYEAIERVGQSDEFLTEITGSSDKLFYVSLSVMVKAKTEAALAVKASQAHRAFTALGGARGILDHMNHDRLFLSSLPLQGIQNPLFFLVRSETLVHLLPLQGSWHGTRKGGVTFKTYRDEPFRMDLFDSSLQAKHGLMLGTTGSGKSFFTTNLLLQFLAESSDNHVIVIDVGGSYRKLAGLLDGSYLEVECSERYALNPFPLKETLFPEDETPDPTYLQFLKELLQKMIDPRRRFTSSEKMILERVIRRVYAPLEKNEVPLLGDIERALRENDSGDREDVRKAFKFAKELTLFTEGEYGKVLNRKGRFDLDARFSVFDLRKISHFQELQEIFLFIIPFALARKFDNRHIQKLLVFDECWQLLKYAQGTELVEVFYRTARKMNAGVLSISQNPPDFLESEISSVLVNNSPLKYILRLKKGHEELSRLGLNPNEIQAVRELEVRPGHYSEVFLKFDHAPVVLKIEPTPLEYWIATTDPKDLAEEERLRLKDNLSELERLIRLAEQFPKGVERMKESSDARG